MGVCKLTYHLYDCIGRVTAGKIVAASLLTVGGGLGGTIIYAKWDPKFRSNVEKTVPYSDQLFGLTLGPTPPPPVIPIPKKPVRFWSLHGYIFSVALARYRLQELYFLHALAYLLDQGNSEKKLC